MTYAMVWIALSLGMGIAAASLCTVSSQLVWIAMAILLVLVVVTHRAPRWVRMAGLLLAVVALGFLRNSLEPAFPEWLIRRAPRVQEVAGVVLSYPDVGEASISFTLAPVDMPGYLIVHADCVQPLGKVHCADTVVVRGSTQLPSAFDGFDYAAYLARQNIFATMFGDEVLVLHEPAYSLRHWGDRLRQRLLQRFRDGMPQPLAAMAQSLMFGDRSALPQDTEDAFSRTGLMHLLAVSGLHLGIFLGGAWWGLRRLGLRPRVAYPVVGLLVLLALVVVGPRVSLVRAGLLFAFLALGSVLADFGLILRRWVRPLNGLAAAAIVLLLTRPGALFDAGFQLTMAATGSILIAFSPSGWATKLSRVIQTTGWWRGWQWGLGLLIVSTAAQAGAAPIIAWHFQAFHPLGIIVNLVAVPLATLALWAGLLATLLAATPLFALAVTPFGVLLWGLEQMVGQLARLPFVAWAVIPEFGVWLAGCVGFVYAANYSLSLSSWMSNSTSMESGCSDG